MLLKTYIKTHKKSPYIFTNSKTGGAQGQKSGAAVDFGICKFMSKNEAGNYTSKVCHGCYAARLINVYPAVRNILENLPMNDSLENFEHDIIEMKKIGMTQIRFYALGDFAPWHMPYIKAAAKHVVVNIISKALAMKPYESFLNELNDEKNIWISLSFNHTFNKRFEELEKFCLSKKSKNIQLNWTINYRDEEQLNDPRVSRVQVVHVTNKKKRDGVEKFGIDEHRICGVFDENGKPTMKGTCHKCNNCHVSYWQYHKKEKKAALPIAA